MYAIVEVLQTVVLSVRTRNTKDGAVALAAILAKENGANKREAKATITEDGFWEEGEYRVTVISVLPD